MVNQNKSNYKPNHKKRIGMKFKPGSGKPKMDLFAIYPDFWAKKWGDPPLLGFVYSEDDFMAVRKAEYLGIYRRNYSFGPMARKVESRDVRLTRKDLY